MFKRIRPIILQLNKESKHHRNLNLLNWAIDGAKFSIGICCTYLAFETIFLIYSILMLAGIYYTYKTKTI